VERVKMRLTVLFSLAVLVSCARAADQGPSGTEFCAYIVDQQGRPEYLNGEALLVPPEGSTIPAIRLVWFIAGKLGAWKVPRGEYDLVLKVPDSVRRVRIRYEPRENALCEPKLLIRDYGSALKAEWHTAGENWIDPQTEALNTVKRLCGKFGLVQSRQVRDARIKALRGVSIRVYKRVQGERCCGELSAEERTGLGRRFNFSKLPNGRFWAVVKVDARDYGIPVVIDLHGSFDECPTLALNPGRGLEFWQTLTVD
jgi:hypothetical protein